MSLLALKLLMLLLILTAGWLGGAVPLLWRQQNAQRSAQNSGNAFAAGLFLATGLLHFLPESAHQFAQLGWHYPAASALAIAAFLLLLLFEHVLLPDAAHDAAHSHSGSTGAPCNEHAHRPSSGSPYILLVALSVHSLLAGIALGTDREQLGAMLAFLAIAVHKASAGLALGLTLRASKLSRAGALRLVSLFALMTPLGVTVGLVAGSILRPGSQLLFDAMATGLAGGTFLYIGAFDLLQDEFLHAGRRWAKLVAAAAGALLAALLAVWL